MGNLQNHMTSVWHEKYRVIGENTYEQQKQNWEWLGKDPRNIILKPIPKESLLVSEGIHEQEPMFKSWNQMFMGEEKNK